MPAKNRRRVTSKHVAELAGVSQTTVSFVLNNVREVNISEETRQRVLQAAHDLNYVPDMTARSLVRGKSNNIALMLGLPHKQVFIDPFIPNIITGVTQITQARGYRLVVEQVTQQDQFETLRSLLRGGEVAGVILNNFHWWDDVISELAADGYPIICLDPVTAPWVHWVSIDHMTGVRQVVAHLIGLGHTRIACITYGPTSDAHVVKRLGIFRETLEDAGIAYDEELVRFGAFDPESGYEAMLSLLSQKRRPTAVFGMNDMMALGAMSAIQESGLRIPEDIAVAGYDDMRFAPFTYPRLTTARAPEIETGRQAGQALLDLIDDKPPTSDHMLLPSQLVIRDSCGAKLKR